MYFSLNVKFSKVFKAYLPTKSIKRFVLTNVKKVLELDGFKKSQLYDGKPNIL